MAPSVLTVQDATCHRGHTRDGPKWLQKGEEAGTQVRVARGGQRHPKRAQIGPEEQRKGEGSVLGEEGGSLSYTRMRVGSQGGRKMKGQTLPGTDASLAPLTRTWKREGTCGLNCEDPQGVHVHSPDSWDAKGKEIQQVSGYLSRQAIGQLCAELLPRSRGLTGCPVSEHNFYSSITKHIHVKWSVG